jgi:wobble nucleotide-excising tRNase
VFRDFQWDQEVQNANERPEAFMHINILYGRNYSGKTTLSRLLRALETKSLSDKYDAPEFTIQFKDGTTVNQTDYVNHNGNIRVFNEDFVRDNLRFINDPDEAIESFALIGDDNVTIQSEIDHIEQEIGSSEDGEESGLYADLKTKTALKVTANTSHSTANSTLQSQMRGKATGDTDSIKYMPEKYGDQNYTIRKLVNEIALVLKDTYTSLTDDEVKEQNSVLEEKAKGDINALELPVLSFSDFSTEAEALIIKKVGESDKIEELAKDAVLNRWVKDGRIHHKSKRESCAFCGNKIEESRWQELDKHFDEESEKLEAGINQLIKRITDATNLLNRAFNISNDSFYTKFQKELVELELSRVQALSLYTASMGSLIGQLQGRADDIIHPKDFTKPDDQIQTVEKVIEDYDALRTEANEYTNQLGTDQRAARVALRLNAVYHFATDIAYTVQNAEIEKLSKELDDATSVVIGVKESIQQKKQLIDSKRREMNDEEKGAKKVNSYLNHFFGHKFLTLEAQESDDPELETKSIRFEITRDGRKAYHLSEGECSLLAFCYFLAKLDDVETRGSKPIIWIDDPISSLDSNHIFFVYSLIASEIVTGELFEQLFISTHNLDFLKYLKRLTGNFEDANGTTHNYQKSYFVVNREDRKSSIQMMPNYLKEYVTEFNYLFNQIYKCATIETVDDTNYTTFYNFSNSARKFLEIYLYYKYPDGATDKGKLERFFGDETIPSIFTDRINNEYSHLCGIFERGETPVEVPEMKTAATLILERLKQDREQYAALLESIGAPPEAEEEGELEVVELA